MYIALKTHEIWIIEDEFQPSRFFSVLGSVIGKGGIVAFSAYEPSERSIAEFEKLGATQQDIPIIYQGTFELNRGEHPNGRSFEIVFTDTITARLMEMCSWKDGQKDKPLFFDHMLAYRRGLPVLPLFCHHDAFCGGALWLSGLFDEKTIRTLAGNLGVTHAQISNPDFKIEAMP